MNTSMLNSTGLASASPRYSVPSDESVSLRKAGNDLEPSQEKDAKKEQEISQEQVADLTGAMNKFLQEINPDLHFALHEETKRLMVQLIDTKNNKVIKEFPSREFLDIIAKVRDYVGTILDIKG